MTKAQVRCAVYTRKSSEEGLEQSFNSLEAQREACTAYIQSQKHEGWAAVQDLYDDGGFSGGTMERPALRQLLDHISAGQIETVVVYKVDRLTRSLADFAKIIEVFDSHGVSFVSVTQQFNTTTSMGRLTLNVLLSFAQFERELTGERIRDKVAASKKRGMWMGGVVPMGYDCVNHRLVVNQSEAATVREIFNQYLRLGSVKRLRDYLDEKSVRSKVRTSAAERTSGGAVYSRGALYHLLNNRIYIGEIVHRKESYPGQHDPIIPREIWDKVAAKLAANVHVHQTEKSSATSSLLTGILRDMSGTRFTPTGAMKKGKRYRYYTSQTVIQQKGKRPHVTRFPAQEIERLVISEIHQLLSSPDKYLTEAEATPEVALAAERARTLASKWSQTETSKQHDFLRGVLKAVVVSHENVWIDVSRARLVSALLGDQAGSSTVADSRVATIRLTVNFKTVRRGVALHVYTPASASSDRAPLPSLVKALGKAHYWYGRLLKVGTVEQLAKESGLTATYIMRILQCAMLSPEVTEAILSGRQAHDLTLAKLVRNPPMDWVEQASSFITR